MVQFNAPVLQAGYQDNIVAAHIWSAVNLTLSGTQTINFYAAQVGDEVLAAGQTTASENGLWIVQSGAWTRHPRWPTGSSYPQGLVVVISNSSFASPSWMMTTPTPVVVGTDTSAWDYLQSGKFGSIGARSVIANTTNTSTTPTTLQIAAGQVPGVAVGGTTMVALTGAQLGAIVTALANAGLATMAAETVKVNATSGSATPTDLAIGAAQHLARGSSGDIIATSPSRVLAQTGSDQTVTNTVTETDLANLTVPASVVAVGDVVSLVAWGDILNNSGSPANFTVRFRLATNSSSLTPAISYAASANKYRWRCQVDLLSLSTTTQDVNFKLDVGGAQAGATFAGALDAAKTCVGTVALSGFGNLANSTVLQLQVTHGTAASTITTVCHASYLVLHRNL